jgi:hypothetical protein
MAQVGAVMALSARTKLNESPRSAKRSDAAKTPGAQRFLFHSRG